MKTVKSVRGFTLVEMLLVVALITLIIAMLLPALGNAKYQARLTLCQARLKQIGSGVLSYAVGSQRLYPVRQGPKHGWKPNQLSGGGVDDRDILSPFLSINSLFNCPLTGWVDFENTPVSISNTASYQLWAGYGYLPAGERPMRRLGGRLTWNGNEFSVLASDRDVVHAGGTWVHGSHPDKSGVTYDEVLDQRQDTHFGGGTYTFSRWQSHTTNQRGLIDMNWLYDDGSVIGLTDVDTYDARMIPVPEFSHGNMWAITFIPEE